MQNPKEFEMPRERNVRPTTRQSKKSAQTQPMEPRNIHFNKRERRSDEWRSPYPLSEGMTLKEMAQTFAACLFAVLAAKGLLDLFAWCVGHFIKGWW
jgi:hypothetical protein